MKKKEVDKILKNQFGNRLMMLDFKKKGYGFYRKKEGFYMDFGYSLVDYFDVFPAQFGMHCGFTAFDNLYNEIFNVDKTDLNVFAISQAGLFENGDYHVFEYEISTEGEALRMVDEVMNYLEKDALPYFESINTIEKIEPVVNELQDPRMGVRGLILAKLAGNPDYPQLKEKYRDLLKDWIDEEKQKLETVIAFLDAHSQENLLEITRKKA